MTVGTYVPTDKRDAEVSCVALTREEVVLLKAMCGLAHNRGNEILTEPMDTSSGDALATQLEDKDLMTRMVPFAWKLHEDLIPHTL